MAGRAKCSPLVRRVCDLVSAQSDSRDPREAALYPLEAPAFYEEVHSPWSRDQGAHACRRPRSRIAFEDVL